ncbi:MlaE family ABC transporter permease [Undibacterium rugosum]|uniref:ABC transporter permease n=1 Tax=Undibacterium rugosum TaxID=2762291 RepID=A0A923IBE0_9BURK|nr:ABC transporter permease [Undibacterium rugosum]MBC3937018.1 ABC transporter permease [Undibacterium rugosum]MBR7777925.1 ABC transporter permease [Undibacterium rugosum]
MRIDTPPTLNVITQNERAVQLQGCWLAHTLCHADRLSELQQQLNQLALRPALQWDLSQIEALDHLGAQLLWRVWQHQLPEHANISEQHLGIFERLRTVSQLAQPVEPKPRLTRVMRLGSMVLGFFAHCFSFVSLLGQLMLDLGHFIRHPLRGPWKEISANIYRMGAQALGITALVGILIGIVLSYLSAQQLKTFGGDLFIVNLLGMSIIRELGPMLAAILVAGRSGSAITAQLGVMRVTEELDAMQVMGIPHGFRLIMPRVLALAIAMPLIVIWTDVMALMGGMIAAQALLGMSPAFFIYKLPEAVPILNYWIGLLKGVSFGVLIALIACHFGLRIEPNTESLGRGTTSSVVISITMVIIADALFAIIFSKTGY